MKKKKQHYVPQLHLERFTFDGERLHVYDKFQRKAFIANKKDLSEENAFYNIPEELITAIFKDLGIYPQIVEDVLSKLEGKYQKAIKDLLNSRQDQLLDENLKEQFCFFLAIQILRTRDTRNLATQMQTKFLQSIVDELVKLNLPDSTGLTPQVEMKHEVIAHLKLILDPNILGTICEMLGNHIWLVGLNETPKTLYTSDTPIVKHHYLEHKYASGWAGPGVEIVFPITPKHALILLERAFFGYYQEIERQWVKLTPDHIEHFNKLQVIASHRQVYCSTDDFDLAEATCKEKPEVCSENRSRVTVNVHERDSDELGKIKRGLEVLIEPPRY